MVRFGCLLGLALVLGCGSESDGGSAALAHYDLEALVTDQQSLRFRGFERTLDISFGTKTTSRAECASLRGMTATFEGQAVDISSIGGWSTLTVPTNNAPGQTATLEGCDNPFLRLVFDPVMGEPQNGTLALDDAHAHFEVTFHHDVGSPTIELVSATADQIVLRLKGFLALPHLDHLSVTLSFGLPGTGLASVTLPKNDLTGDGLLTLAIPAPMVPTSFTSVLLLFSATLGEAEALPCVGFNKCLGFVFVARSLDIALPNR